MTEASSSLFSAHLSAPTTLLPSWDPAYETGLGAAYIGDSLEAMKTIPDNSVDLVITSPPYALHSKKPYGNVAASEYVAWFLPFAAEIRRILKDDGSFVLNISGSWNRGHPTRSISQYKLLIALVEETGFHLAQESYWYNPAKMPVPAEWVTVRRIRIKDAVEHIWWFGKTEWPKANNRTVLKPYSKDMLRLNARGLKATRRPGGHAINEGFSKVESGGSIPANVIQEALENRLPDDFLVFGNNSANDKYTKRCKEAGLTIHPARFPAALPEFFIKLVTVEGDIVLDPFAGSNTTGAVCERLSRRWLAFDEVKKYVEGGKFRFEASELAQRGT
ncbi:DNA-methyltransferase [Thetidibacter halocola]|uniref:Methyltransferase n=1 Tax=Thetidibacter halocola TaxID=2827239 RepID=A0A8J7WCF6_9RHOB|nr:site-specific DNA-methyltransferase [Thetidibacter halocola]MBS0125065.1 site-specific DNA-methyltransferase [Thetidibacter halocola]